MSQLRSWQLNDRRVMDLANRAFVASVQAYAKHECNFVLRMKDFPFGAVASAFGLLRMPRMPELKNRKIVDFKQDPRASSAQKLNLIKYK